MGEFWSTDTSRYRMCKKKGNPPGQKILIRYLFRRRRQAAELTTLKDLT